jgi:hypothetical protein
MRYYNIEGVEEAVYFLMLKQCNGVKWVQEAFFNAWDSFKSDDWKYDGATFVKENNDEFWEVASFIHDWMNCIGFVGKKVDLYFIKIMIALNYNENIIFERCKWMQYTFLNFFRHWVMGNNPKNEVPIKIK